MYIVTLEHVDNIVTLEIENNTVTIEHVEK